MNNWKFNDLPNTAVITSKNIINNLGWIGYVCHDDNDGGWQFLESSDNKSDTQEVAVVSLKNILELDPSVLLLADLPIGSSAHRKTKESVWILE